MSEPEEKHASQTYAAAVKSHNKDNQVMLEHSVAHHFPDGLRITFIMTGDPSDSEISYFIRFYQENGEECHARFFSRPNDPGSLHYVNDVVIKSMLFCMKDGQVAEWVLPQDKSRGKMAKYCLNLLPLCESVVIRLIGFPQSDLYDSLTIFNDSSKFYDLRIDCMRKLSPSCEDPDIYQHLKERMKRGGISCVIGRPGTGKTSAIVSSIAKGMQEKKKILILSSYNVAVDHIAQKLADYLFKESFLEKGTTGEKRRFLQASTENRFLARVASLDAQRKSSRPYANIASIEPAEWDPLEQKEVVATTIAQWEKKLCDMQTTLPMWDEIIVEEASTAMVMDIYFASLTCRRLVLVGDPNQLFSITDMTLKQRTGNSSDVTFFPDIFTALGVSYEPDEAEGITMLEAQHRLPKQVDSFIVDAFYPGLKETVERQGDYPREEQCADPILQELFPDAINLCDLSCLRLHAVPLVLTKAKGENGRTSPSTHCNVISAAISVKIALSFLEEMKNMAPPDSSYCQFPFLYGCFCTLPWYDVPDAFIELLDRYWRMDDATLEKGQAERAIRDALCAYLPDDSLRKRVEPRRIGIITPFRAQQDLMEAMLLDVHQTKKGISINTISSFQGQECDVVIIDLVESNPILSSKVSKLLVDDKEQTGEDSPGQLSRLLNVAISRTRWKCVVVSDFSFFQRNLNSMAKRDRMDSPLSKLMRFPLTWKGKRQSLYSLDDQQMLRRCTAECAQRNNRWEPVFLRYLSDETSHGAMHFWVANSSSRILTKEKGERRKQAETLFSKEDVLRFLSDDEVRKLWFVIGEKQSKGHLCATCFKDKFRQLLAWKKPYAIILPEKRPVMLHDTLLKEMRDDNVPDCDSSLLSDRNPYDLSCMFAQTGETSYRFVYGLIPEKETNSDKNKEEGRKGRHGIVFCSEGQDHIFRFFVPKKLVPKKMSPTKQKEKKTKKGDSKVVRSSPPQTSVS